MQKIFDYLRKRWRPTAIILGAALIAVSATAVFFLSTLRSRQFDAGAAGENGAPAAPAPAVARVYSDLYAVAIDNHADARPAAGVNQAAFVYEVPVEGGITRFLAFFERTVSVEEIGPVRSARPYFLDWITQDNAAAFFHVGGSPEALARIAATPALSQIDEDGIAAAGKYYWRDESRDAPHNTFTSSEKTDKVFASRLGSARQLNAWLMEGDPATEDRGADGQMAAVNLSQTPAYSPIWVYSQADNSYARTIGGKTQKDAAGAAVTAKNIVIMETAISVLDSVGRLKVTTSGKGRAVIYRNGQTENATWETSGSGKPVRFYAVDGSEAVLTEGNVWIEVVRE